MAQWDDGYVTDVVYTTNFYREITPSWLAMTSLLLGHRPPDLAKRFSYADLGCGNGINALVVAATCPHADVWGFDFNPAHVEFASVLAAHAGLRNVRFVEASFAELEAMPGPELPDFDIMASHGTVSWISPANRRCLVGARSFLSASSRAAITLKRFLRSSMSMKSMTMMPPRSRRRI